MRIILSLLLGFFSFFFLSEMFKKLFGRPIPSFISISVIILGFIIGFWGKRYVFPPLDLLASLFVIGAGVGMLLHHLLSMRYIISEEYELKLYKRHESLIDRLLEILPGALTWTALTSPFWLSLTLPFAVAYFIIAADVYWLFSSLRVAILIFVGYRKLQFARAQPWLENLKKDFPAEWGNYNHLLVLPTYKESIEILAPAFDAIEASNYPKDKIFMAIGFEAWDDPDKIKETKKYLERFSKKIGGVFITTHELQPGEVRGPGTNRNWMIKNSVKEFEKKGINANQVFVTTLDADFVIDKEFLSGALHKYLSTPAEVRDKRTYTGSFLYYNNFWQAPAPMRLIAAGTAFWQLAEMVGSDKYQNFSSLSINLKPLLEIGGWMPDKVNDDSGFYWKAYFHFNGDYKVLPHYLPISADANLDTSLFKTFQNQYQQLKRWAYGVEHIPFVFKQYFKRHDIDFWDKTDKLLFVLWANLKWGSLALLVTFAGIIIPIINPNYSESVVAINLPIISSYILTVAFLGLFVTVYVQEKTAPPRPKNWKPIKKIWTYLQYLLVPIVLVTITTVPAIDAQTSLMFGRYLEFRVTNKARSK